MHPCPVRCFAPAGLSVAVKRDRAMESLLPVGAAFVLNVLAEGREKSMMKQVRGRLPWQAGCRPAQPLMSLRGRQAARPAAPA